MGFFVEQPWLAVAVPFGMAVLVALGGRRLSRLTQWLALAGPLTVLAVGAQTAREVLSAEGAGALAPYVTARFGQGSFAWLQTLGGPNPLGMPTIGWAVDGLAALMLLIVGVVATCVMVFSVGYMRGDRGLARYYGLLSLFTAAMSLLVIADGFVGLFIGWELVGACSFLLIGFWYERAEAAAAATKAFLVTRVGDVGLLLALALVWRETGQVDYIGAVGGMQDAAPALLAAAALLVFVGAAGKSAQFPLHIWLPDAMAGPTPVSALIHAATMVAAGVFLVARVWPLFEMAPVARDVVLVIGAFTALGSATVAVTQSDIKKVLAYSTISQLGFMFAALGASAWHAAIFHLTTHAAFKALLFLGAGSVIHGSGTQDLREMGGLWRRMPVTATTWVLGSLALAGIPPLAGFFSKDEIVASVLHRSPVAAVVLMTASLLTAFYIARATRLAFFGAPRGEGHAHEGGLSMTAPLVLLSVGAVALGFAGGTVAGLLGGEAEAISVPVAVVAVTLALVGGVAGWVMYALGPARDEALGSRLGGAWRSAFAGWRADDAVAALVTRPAQRLAAWSYAVAERRGIDAAVEGTGRTARRLSDIFGGIQSGDGQWYLYLVGFGLVMVLALPALLDALARAVGR